MTPMSQLLERQPQTSITEVAIAVTNLGFSYPDLPDVLQQVSLTVQPGERIGVIGANGCGKTTLFKLLCGVLPPP
jgi:cobalt/nickel transport system ATP-binding protein